MKFLNTSLKIIFVVGSVGLLLSFRIKTFNPYMLLALDNTTYNCLWLNTNLDKQRSTCEIYCFIVLLTLTHIIEYYLGSRECKFYCRTYTTKVIKSDQTFYFEDNLDGRSHMPRGIDLCD